MFQVIKRSAGQSLIMKPSLQADTKETQYIPTFVGVLSCFQEMLQRGEPLGVSKPIEAPRLFLGQSSRLRLDYIFFIRQ